MSDVVIKLSATDSASGVIERVAHNVRDLGKTVEAQHGAFSALEQVAVGALRQVGAAAVNLAGAGITALADQLRSSIDVAATFESAIYKFQAVAGDALEKAGFSFDAVRKKALELGASTQFSAQQALDAMTELVKGGVAVESVMSDATDATLALAAAAQLDLANAAEIVAKQLGVWGATGVTAAQVADLLASAANASTVDVEELALGLANVGGSARVAGLSFEEVVQTMALISPAFSSAADAGTSLKVFLSRLVPASDAAAEAMRNLGLLTEEGTSKFFDAEGRFIGMEEAAGLLSAAVRYLSEEEKLMALNTIFGSDAIRAAAAIAEAGWQGYEAMGQAMRDAGGAAAAAATMQQGYSYTVDQLNAAIETLQITIGSALLPFMTQLVAKTADNINAFTAWVSGILSAEDPVAALANQLGLVGVTTDSVRQAFTDLTTILQSTWNALTGALSGPVGDIRQMLVEAGTAIKPAWDEVVKAFNNLPQTISNAASSIEPAWNTIKGAFDKLPEIIANVVSFIEPAWNALKGLFENLPQIISDVVSFIETTWAKIGPSTTDAWNAVSSTIQTVLTKVQEVVTFVISLVMQIWKEHGDEIMAFAINTWNGIMGVIEAAAGFIQEVITQGTELVKMIWNNFGSSIMEIAEFAWNEIRLIVENGLSIVRDVFNAATALLRGDWDKAWESIKSAAFSIWDTIKGTAENLMNSLSDIFKSLYPHIEAGFKDAITGAPSLGAAVIDGITGGVIRSASNLARAVADAARSALEDAKRTLGIFSPSRVAAKEVGVPLGQGILAGLAKGLAPLPLLTREAVTQAGSTTMVNVGGITVNATAGMDERRVAQLVRDEINSLVRLARFGRM